MPRADSWLEGETPHVLEQMVTSGQWVASRLRSIVRGRQKSDSRMTPWQGAFCEVDITPDLVNER